MSSSSARNAYLAGASETASPARLVVMLYDALAGDLHVAEHQLRAGRRPEANERLLHAQAILHELDAALDESAWDGGRGLASLYEFLLAELVRANVERDPERVAAARAVVEPLRDTWREALDGPARGRSVVA